MNTIPFPEDCAARFEPVRLLGEGAFGAVYLATESRLDRPVVIKLLLAGVIDSEDHRERFAMEARITSSLSHPNIVVIYDHGAETGIPWIAYEYLPGGTLAERLIKLGAFAWRDALSIVDQVAAALSEAHARGILHRDIKPANVLEADQGLYKVTDFGIAKWTHEARSLTTTGSLVGSPGYISPEQILGDPATERSDIYSLGISLFQILTGRLPHEAAMGPQLLAAHVNSPLTPPSRLQPDIPAAVDTLVLRCAAKAPADRYGSAAELRQAVASALAAPTAAAAGTNRSRASIEIRTRTIESIASPQAPLREPSPRSFRIPLAVLSLAALIGLWTWAGRSPDRPAPPRAESPRESPPGRLELAELEERFRTVFARTAGRQQERYRLLHLAGLGSVTIDFPRALALARELRAQDATDLTDQTAVFDTLSAAFPEMLATPDRALKLLVRSSAQRFVLWYHLQRDRLIETMSRAGLSEKRNALFDVTWLTRWENLPVDPAGLVYCQKFFDLAPIALERVHSAVVRSDLRFVWLMDDAWSVGSKLAGCVFRPATAADAKRRIAAFEGSLDPARPGRRPDAQEELLARAVLGAWHRGLHGATVRTSRPESFLSGAHLERLQVILSNERGELDRFLRE